MATTTQFSVNAASVLLEKPRRTIAKAMIHIKPDSVQKGSPRWRMTKIINALEHTGSPAAKKTPALDRPDLSSERALLAKSQRRTVDLKHQLLSGQSVLKDVMVEVIRQDYMVVRNSALAMAGKLSDQLSGKVYTRAEVSGVITSEVHQWLTDLSKLGRAEHLMDEAASGDDGDSGDDDGKELGSTQYLKET
jgi:hypothetical protein